jgi:hypothetical protein
MAAQRWLVIAAALLVAAPPIALTQEPAPAQPAIPENQPEADSLLQRLRRGPDPVKAGDEAPDFSLKSADGKQVVTLSTFRGKKPVALVFGSYT